MRRITWLQSIILTGALTCIAPLSSAGSIALDLQPSAVSGSNGDVIALDLTISGLGSFAAESLGAFDVTVGFDPAALAFSSYSLGANLGDPGLAEAIDGSAGDLGGAVNVAEVSLLSVLDLDALQPGSFTLATLNFTVTNLLAGASTQLAVLPGNLLGDALGAPLVASGLGSATVSNVPEPATLALMLIALLGLLVQYQRPTAQLPAHRREQLRQ